MSVIALALGASVAWGLSDFLAGLSSRRLPVLTVLLVSQLFGLVLVLPLVGAQAHGPDGAGFVLWASLAGVAEVLGFAAFYRAMATGAISVVAPITATAALVPLTVGIVAGERPSPLEAGGLALALVGVALASCDSIRGSGEARREQLSAGVGLASLAALGFGLFFVLLERASEADIWWTVLVNRAASLVILVGVASLLRPQLRVERKEMGGLAAIGGFDIGANTLFATAAGYGQTSLVGVLGSMYPITTVLLARVLLRERLRSWQDVGVVATLAGVAIVAAASAMA